MTEGDGTTALEARGWHGTRRLFDVFDPARSEAEYGCFFADTPEAALVYADDQGGRIVEAVLRFENPYRCTADEWSMGSSADPAKVAMEGVHDGYVIEGVDGTTFVAWKAGSIHRQGDPVLHGSEAFEAIRARIDPFRDPDGISPGP